MNKTDECIGQGVILLVSGFLPWIPVFTGEWTLSTYTGGYFDEHPFWWFGWLILLMCSVFFIGIGFMYFIAVYEDYLIGKKNKKLRNKLQDKNRENKK